MTTEERIEAALLEAVPQRPLHCLQCGSDLVMSTLLAPGEVECWEPDCLAVWTVER